jgi:hypothetical protein
VKISATKNFTFAEGEAEKKNLRSSGRRFGPQSLNVAIKQMSYGSGFRAEAPAGKG